MRNKKLLTAILGLGMVLNAGAVLAEKQLSADEVKALFVGKTADGTNVIKGKNYKLYTKDATSAVHKNAKRTKDVSWHVTEDGQHCVQLNKLHCGHIMDMGNGVYHKVSDGEHINTLKNFQEGNHIDG